MSSELRVIDAKAWDNQGANAPALASLEARHALVLSRFLRYWLNDTGEGPDYDRRTTDTQFDY